MVLVFVVIWFIKVLSKHYLSLRWIFPLFIRWSKSFWLWIFIWLSPRILILFLFILLSALILFSFIIVKLMMPIIWVMMTLLRLLKLCICLIVAPSMSVFFLYPIKCRNFIFIVLNHVTLSLDHHSLSLVLFYILPFIFSHIQSSLVILYIAITRLFNHLIIFLNICFVLLRTFIVLIFLLIILISYICYF